MRRYAYNVRTRRKTRGGEVNLTARWTEQWRQSKVAHVLVDLATGKALEANPAAEALWRRPLAELQQCTIAELFDPAARDAFAAWTQDRERDVLGYPVIPQIPGGARSGFTSVTLEACRTDDDTCLCRFHASESDNSEDEIRNLNWALQAYARSARALIRARSLSEMAEQVCRAIVERDDYALAAIAMREGDGRFLRIVALAGDATGYADGLRLSSDPADVSGQGPTGLSIRSGIPVVMHDSRVDPVFAPWRERAAAFGIRSSVTVPFCVDEQVVGVVLVYASRPMAFTARAIQTFYELGEELAFAIGVLQNRQRLREAQSALHDKQDELARVARALSVGEFASSIAHETAQPLAAIMTNCETALRWLGENRENIPAARQALQRSIRDCRRAHEVIQRTRAMLASHERKVEPCNLNRILQDVVELLRDDLSRAEVQVDTAFAPYLPRVMADDVQLQQVIINLVMNARDAMRDITTRPRTLRIESGLGENGTVIVTITDNGDGMAEDVANRMFDHFFTTKKGGIGLGLSISRSIVEAHGGRLWGEPVAPFGAAFHIVLPAEQPRRTA